MKRRILGLMVSLVSTVVLLVSLSACSSAKSYSLEVVDGGKGDWGSISYLIDPTWNAEDWSDSLDGATRMYSAGEGEDIEYGFMISFKDPDSPYSDTESEWLAEEEAYHTQTAQEQYDASSGTLPLDEYYSYSDYSCELVGEVDADGCAFNLYFISYVMTTADGAESWENEQYVAVCKDFQHDIEVLGVGVDEQLIRDFVSTISVL